MSKARVKHSWKPGELQSDAKTLRYEFDMLIATASNLNSGRGTDTATRNALVESFAAHCRNLIFFFFAHDDAHNAGAPRSGDILAVDFFKQDSGWIDVCPSIAKTLSDAKRSMDKEVAHITVDRRGLNQQDGPTSDWPVGVLVLEIAGIMMTFLKHADLENFHPETKDHLLQLAERVLTPVQPSLPYPPPSSADAIRTNLVPPVLLHGRTDIRTTTIPPGSMFGMHAKTEP